MARRRLNLLERFALLSFLGVLLLCVALGFMTSSVLTRSMLDGEWETTAEVVRHQVGTHSPTYLFTESESERGSQPYREALGRLMTLPHVVRVKVWSRDGTVVWSDDSRLIGRRFPENRELQGALGGAVTVHLKDLRKSENVYEREQFVKLAEVYVPVLDEANRKVIGVLEVYKTSTRLFERIRQAQAIVWSVSAAGGLLLYLSLFGIVRVSHRTQMRLSEVLREQVGLTEEKDRLLAATHTQAAALERKNKELDTFVYTVSHDLKAPLVTLQGMADLLGESCERDLDEQGRHYVTRIKTNAQQMERLVQDLLALSRIGREGREPEAVGLDDVVDELLMEGGERIRARGVTVTRHELPTLWGVRTQIEQVVSNLLGNAIKYLGDTPAPVVEIGAKDGGAEMVECYVKDNGIGIDPAYHEKVFEIFQRLQETEAEGTGVGLAIVKKIIEGAGGRIWVESAKGQGAAFRFTWPRAEVAA